MGKTEDIEKLGKNIIEAEDRLKSFKDIVEKNDKEISVLSLRKTDLEKNIVFLKKSYTVPLAHEYKRAKLELAQVRVRLSAINLDRGKANQACKEMEKIINKFKKDQEALIKSGENNVLQLFGGKNGKK